MEQELAMVPAQAIEPGGQWMRLRHAGILDEQITPHVVYISLYHR